MSLYHCNKQHLDVAFARTPRGVEVVCDRVDGITAEISLELIDHLADAYSTGYLFALKEAAQHQIGLVQETGLPDVSGNDTAVVALHFRGQRWIREDLVDVVGGAQ